MDTPADKKSNQTVLLCEDGRHNLHYALRHETSVTEIMIILQMFKTEYDISIFKSGKEIGFLISVQKIVGTRVKTNHPL